MATYSSVLARGDGGAWWAAIYGVAQSRTRPKRLSSSSSKDISKSTDLKKKKKKNLLSNLTDAPSSLIRLSDILIASVNGNCLVISTPKGSKHNSCKIRGLSACHRFLDIIFYGFMDTLLFPTVIHY